MSVSINIDTTDYDSKIETVRGSITEFIPRLVREGSAIIQQEMAGQVPVKTGNLRSSIRSDISGSYSETGTHTGYGLFVDQPTRPHTIRPKIGPYLRFQIGGQVIYAKQVQHPGTKGNFFIKRTTDVIMPKLTQLASQIWNELVSK